MNSFIQKLIYLVVDMKSIIIINTLVSFFFFFFYVSKLPFNLMFDSKFIKALHCIVVFVTKHYSVCDLLQKNKNKYKNCMCSKL